MLEKREQVEQLLLKIHNERGFISEDEIIDVCLEYDLDVVEIDVVCEKILSQHVILKDSITQQSEDEVFVDRSQIDYDVLYNKVVEQYPSMKHFVEEIKSIIPPQNKEWKMLIPQAQAGNDYAKNRMILMYSRTVLKQAYDFSKAYFVDLEEAFENGILGLYHAIEKYDVTSPDPFGSYLSLWIRQTMQRYCEPKYKLCRYPVHYKDKIFKAINIIISEQGSESFEEIIDYYSNDEVTQMVDDGTVYQHLLSYIDIYDEEAFLMTSDFDLDAVLSQKCVSDVLRVELKKLNLCEKEVVEKRYGLIDGQSRTLEEVGTELGVTRERIRQIEAKALRKMRQPKVLKKLSGFFNLYIGDDSIG